MLRSAPRPTPRTPLRPFRVVVACAALLAIGACAGTSAAAAAAPGSYAPGEILVKYADATQPAARAATARAAGGIDPVAVAAHTRMLHLAAGVSLVSALDQLRRQRDVEWAVPDYVAHV